MNVLTPTEWQYLADKVESLAPEPNFNGTLVFFICLIAIGLAIFLNYTFDGDFESGVLIGGLLFVPVCFSILFFAFDNNALLAQEWVAKYATLKAQQPSIEKNIQSINDNELVLYEYDEAKNLIEGWTKNRDDFVQTMSIHRNEIDKYSSYINTISENASKSMGHDVDILSMMLEDELNIDSTLESEEAKDANILT